MNVLLINGSPHKNGCTNAALTEMAKVLNEAGIETTIFHIGSAPVGGCVGCGGCSKAGKCVFGGPVADVLPLVEKADGIVFGAQHAGLYAPAGHQRRQVSAPQARGCRDKRPPRGHDDGAGGHGEGAAVL